MKRTVVGLTIIVVFSLLVFVAVVNTIHELDASNLLSEEPNETSSFMIYFMPILAFTGVGVGAVLYYVLGERMERTKSEEITEFRSALLATLGPKEGEVIQLLLEHKGAMSQYDLKKFSSFNKVQMHRLLLNMENKGLITKKKKGRTNQIAINKQLRALLY